MVTQANALVHFDPFRVAKFGVGFDTMLDWIQSDFFSDSFQGTQNFPPYNIIKRDEIHYDIEMAVAGFSEKELEIEYADNTLIVKSVNQDSLNDSKKEEDEERRDTEFVHRGIAVRQFTRQFSLADDVIVTGANLKNGMLSINMEKVIPEGKEKRLIDIVSE